MDTGRDREVLRRLAGQVRAIADLPVMAERAVMWRRHNALRGDRPMVLAFPEGAWRELLPADRLECVDEQLRGWERALRMQIIASEQVADDNYIEPYFNLNWRVTRGDYGVPVPQHKAEERGSYVWDAPIKDIDRDFHKLHFRSLTLEREQTLQHVERARSIFGDILPVRIRGSFWWTLGLTWEAAKLVGLENLMLLMYDQPQGLHRVMAWLRDEHMHMIDWFESQGLLTLNNGADYTGSGGVGCTDELPSPGYVEGKPARLIDRWGFGESQETVGISPAMFAEFVLPYQLPLLERFGLNCYGCCEGLEHRIELVTAQVPRLRRVSVAPSANQKRMAEVLAGRYIFSRKAPPTLVAFNFSEDAIRQDVRRTLDIAAGQTIEFILKDTHTVEGDGSRIGKWVAIARDEIERRRT